MSFRTKAKRWGWATRIVRGVLTAAIAGSLWAVVGDRAASCAEALNHPTVPFRLYAAPGAHLPEGEQANVPALWAGLPKGWKRVAHETAASGTVRATAALVSPDGSLRLILQLMRLDDVRTYIGQGLESAPNAFAVSVLPATPGGRSGYTVRYLSGNPNGKWTAALEYWVALNETERSALKLDGATYVRLAIYGDGRIESGAAAKLLRMVESLSVGPRPPRTALPSTTGQG
ncbi:MAG: hypothetical protein IMW86_07145 [Hydrogenibacillus sp.]|nr:hypothetical protein [Hydrogenibacillus sp.]